jgi:hypothetical protein
VADSIRFHTIPASPAVPHRSSGSQRNCTDQPGRAAGRPRSLTEFSDVFWVELAGVENQNGNYSITNYYCY